MKKTSSMVYKPTVESRELYLVTTNGSRIYPAIVAVENKLAKKIARGIYDAEKATAAFFRITTEASKQYMKDYGYMFSVTERWTAAQDMRDSFISEYNLQGV